MTALKLTDFTGFLTHYGSELQGIVQVIETAFQSLPVSASVATNVTNILEDLKQGSAAVLAAANSLNGIGGDGSEIVVRQEDIDAAVARIAKPLIDEAISSALQAHANA